MKVFLSWSMRRSRMVAEAFYDLAERCLPGVELFKSDSDIRPGQQWAAKLMSELSETHIGVAFVTPENKSRDWLLFEAGAIAMSPSRQLIVVRTDLNEADLESPLSIYQNRSADNRSEVSEILEVLGEDLPEAAKNVRDEYLDAFWPKYEERVRDVQPFGTKPGEGGTPIPVRGVDEKIDELLSLVRELGRVPMTGVPVSCRHRGRGSAVSYTRPYRRDRSRWSRQCFSAARTSPPATTTPSRRRHTDEGWRPHLWVPVPCRHRGCGSAGSWNRPHRRDRSR